MLLTPLIEGNCIGSSTSFSAFYSGDYSSFSLWPLF